VIYIAPKSQKRIRAHWRCAQVKRLKVKRYSSPEQVTSELRGVTCHMGPHSVTRHPTQVNLPRLTPARKTGTRFTYPGEMEG